MKVRLILGFSVFFAFLFFVGLYLDNQLIRLIAKPLPLVFLLFLLKPENLYKKLIFIGLIFSILGDILLELPYNLFVFGLLAFLVAHINYVIAFVKRNNTLYLFSAVGFYLLGGIIYFILFPSLNEMAIPVAVYMIVILTMLWRAYAQFNFDSYSKLAFFGAALFVFSDSMIAFDKFYTPITYANWIIMIAYWSSQYLIFWSAYKEDLDKK